MNEVDRTDEARPRARRVFRGPKTVEAYLRASSPPGYMQRLAQIEAEYQEQRRRLEAAYRALEDACGDDPDQFSRRWRAQADAWRFDELNELVREHNTWYPVEVNLPMDPRSRDFVALRGESYRRIELGPEWVIEHFPPSRPRNADRPKVPRLSPREPAPARR